MKTFPFLCLAVAACGGIATDPNATTPGQPPPVPTPDTVVSSGSTTVTFAIDKLLLGERAPNGPIDATAWRGFGYDLDHKTTTSTSTDVCSPAPNAFIGNQTDGNDGIDNAWGLSVLPIMDWGFSMPTPTDVASDAIAAGATTLEIVVTGLPADRTASASGLTASTFVGATNPGASFDPNQAWPVDASSLADGATLAGGARTHFDAAYMNRGTFVSGASAAPLALNVPLVVTVENAKAPTSVTLPLSIHDAVITFDATTGDTISGTIAGVLDVNEAAAITHDVLRRLKPEFCAEPTETGGIEAAIRESADILVDGSNHAGTPCDGISIGVRFEARRIGNPATVVQSTMAPACE